MLPKNEVLLRSIVCLLRKILKTTTKQVHKLVQHTGIRERGVVCRDVEATNSQSGLVKPGAAGTHGW